MSYGVGCTYGSDLALMWLWYRPTTTATIQPLAWNPPYATALKERKKKKKVKFNININTKNQNVNKCKVTNQAYSKHEIILF